MKIHCLGAGQEVGRSCFLIETDQRVLFDYGLKIFSKEGHSKSGMVPIPYEGKLDAMFLSHAHLDHSGYIPELYSRPPIHWFATPPTLEIASILWQDSLKLMGEAAPYSEQHMKYAKNNFAPLMYEQLLSLGDTDYSFHDAGHILGSAMIRATYKKKHLVYSGDFKTGNTRMHAGASPPDKVDCLILESTYSNREHPNREELESRLIKSITETLDVGGTVLLPAFAVGRTQELLSILNSKLQDVPIFVDGMGKTISTIYQNNPEYLRDSKEFEDALTRVVFVQSPSQRREATNGPAVIVSTAGMMEGGPALSYLQNLSPSSKLIFTGYNVSGTNGSRILNEHKVRINDVDLELSVPAEYFDFSAHVGHKGLIEFVKTTNPEKIILNHGDNTPAFAIELQGMGFDAVAPTNGDVTEF